MPESDTTLLQKPEANGSTFFGVSVRAWIALMLVSAIAGSYLLITTGVVLHAILSKDWSLVGTFANVSEPLGTLSTMAVGFYLGQRQSKPA